MADATQQTQQTAAPATPEEPKWAKDLAASMEKMGQGIQQIVQIAQRPAPQPTPTTTEEEDDTPQSVLDDANLEMLPRRELLRRLEDSFDARLQAALKPVAEAIDKNSLTVQAEAYKADAIRVAESRPDFAFWEKEMLAIAGQNPTLPMGDIYLLARAKHPAKAAEIDTKLAEEAKTRAAAAEPAPKGAKRQPLSLTPASGNATVTNQKMAPEEAGEDAWSKAVAEFGDIFKE